MIPRRMAAAAVGAALALSAAACGTQGNGTGEAAKYPSKALNIMAPAAPGGGWDSTARSLQQTLKDANLTTEAVEVTNVAGAAGTVGLAQLVTKSKGDAHQLMVTGLVMVGGVVTNQSAVTLADTTPIATLTAEAEIIVVKADSPYADLAGLVAAWKEDPTSVKWGGGSAGGTDHILVGLLAKAAGIDPEAATYVPYSGGGEAKAALLSGDLGAAVSGVSEFKDLVESGQVRALAVSGSTSAAIGAAKVPTLTEAGFALELLNWRGIVAPPGITDAEKAAITELIDKLHASPAWRDMLTQQGWDDFYQSGPDAASFFTSESERIKAVLVDIGLATS